MLDNFKIKSNKIAKYKYPTKVEVFTRGGGFYTRGGGFYTRSPDFYTTHSTKHKKTDHKMMNERIGLTIERQLYCNTVFYTLFYNFHLCFEIG